MVGLFVLTLAILAEAASAQGPTMPSTLRYGSGLLDVPVSSVLPAMQLRATYSGFWSSLGQRVEIGEDGQPSGYGPASDQYYSDASVSIGLFDRLEAGVTIQSIAGQEDGGSMVGAFGRLRLWQPVDQGIGLAVGGRYVRSPSFGDGMSYAPGRLGFPDERLRTSYTVARGLHSDLSVYAVATAYLRGYDGGFLPENDLTLSLGYGSGMFRDGDDLDFYAPSHTGGWFVGTSLHLGMGERSQLVLTAEHNGFDVNLGAQYDWDGFRVGAHMLATNHAWPSSGQYSEYQKPKFGVMASIAICPRERGLRCRPRGMERTEPDTIFMPAPPPDTVVLGQLTADTGSTGDLDGEPVSLCLATGRNLEVRVSAAGDTLVGSGNVPLDDLRPGLAFAGSYAGDAFWYSDGRVVLFEGGDYGKSEDLIPMDCDQILRVGVYEGVPVFAVITARRPLDVIFVPVRPGLWHRYVRGLRQDGWDNDPDGN